MPTPPTVLVIEDDAAIAGMVKTLLESRGYRANWIPNGPDGLSAARRELPRLILLDIMLPGMDGFEVCRILKTDSRTKGIKIIMLTGLGKVADVDKAFLLGADDYVIKPFKAEWLLKKIQQALGLPA